MNKPYSILVTRELDDSQIALAEELELDVAIEPAIRIEYRHDWFSVETILKNTDQPIFAFTSQNGVKAFQGFLKTQSGFSVTKPVYAVGTKTAGALSKAGIDASIPKQQNGAGLARKIVEDFSADPGLKDATILHFCGDKRRDEFRQFLQDADVGVRDVVVYKTILNNMNIPQIPVAGILFFSPSGVQAYRKSGGFRNTQVPELFAIGSTTAEELSIETGKHVHISPEPSTEALLNFVKRIMDEI